MSRGRIPNLAEMLLEHISVTPNGAKHERLFIGELTRIAQFVDYQKSNQQCRALLPRYNFTQAIEQKIQELVALYNQTLSKLLQEQDVGALTTPVASHSVRGQPQSPASQHRTSFWSRLGAVLCSGDVALRSPQQRLRQQQSSPKICR